MLFSIWDLVGWVWQKDRSYQPREGVAEEGVQMLSHGVWKKRDQEGTNKLTEWRDHETERLCEVEKTSVRRLGGVKQPACSTNCS